MVRRFPREALFWYDERHEQDARDRLRAAFAPDPAFDLSDPALGVLATEWYDASAVHRVLDLMADGKSAAERDALAREIADATVERVSHGVYRFLVRKLISPHFYARHIQTLWSQVHSTGRREMVVEDAAKRAISRTADWAGHHPMLCRVAMETVGAFFRVMGLEDVRVTPVSCVDRGDETCVAELTWR